MLFSSTYVCKKSTSKRGGRDAHRSGEMRFYIHPLTSKRFSVKYNKKLKTNQCVYI